MTMGDATDHVPFLAPEAWTNLLRVIWPAWALDEGFAVREERGDERFPCVIRVTGPRGFVDVDALDRAAATDLVTWEGSKPRDVPPPVVRWLLSLPHSRLLTHLTAPSREAEDATDPTPEQVAELTVKLFENDFPARGYAIYVNGHAALIVAEAYEALYSLRQARRTLAGVIAQDRARTVRPPSGRPFRAVGTATARGAIGDLFESAGPCNSEQFLNLLGLLAHRDHLAAQVTELQAANTALVMERRKLTWLLDGHDAALRGAPTTSNPYRDDNPAHHFWHGGHEVVRLALAKARGEVAPTVDGLAKPT